MFEYLPWSERERAACLELYQKGQFSILDIELGGECNYNCVYCDSPDRQKGCSLSLDEVEKIIEMGAFRWVYICGLGEPTYEKNYKMLIGILHLCEKYGLRCSIFSNISHLTEELKEYVSKQILYILFKYDTKNDDRVKMLYGTSKPEIQLQAIDELRAMVHFENGMTNIAASIVPTQFNYKEILDIVDDCMDSHMFPLLGELELSGKGQTNYDHLFLNKEELILLKKDIEKKWGGKYEIPICPAVINGIHINNRSDVTVDAYSGLSCHWFWLKEPMTATLTHFSSESSSECIREKILEYRRKSFSNVEDYLKADGGIGDAFGGCGGDVKKLFEEYKCASKKRWGAEK